MITTLRKEVKPCHYRLYWPASGGMLWGSLSFDNTRFFAGNDQYSINGIPDDWDGREIRVAVDLLVRQHDQAIRRPGQWCCVTVSYGQVKGRAKNYRYYQAAKYVCGKRADGKPIWQYVAHLGTARRSFRLALADALEQAESLQCDFIAGIRRYNPARVEGVTFNMATNTTQHERKFQGERL